MSQLVLASPLVTTQWLAEHIDHPGLVVLDASWFMPGTPRKAEHEWFACRIPRSRFFDFDKKVLDEHSPLPHMLPSPEVFAREVSLLGIKNSDAVVIYDSQGIFSAPRAWWMFRAMGHRQVAVLDGGLPAWQRADFKTCSGLPKDVAPTTYRAQLVQRWVATSEEVKSKLDSEQTVILDARGLDRFAGKVSEPRPGVRSGHMPGAKNLPFARLLDDGHFLPMSKLAEIFYELESNTAREHLFTCGSGVTACILALAAELVGRNKLMVYDGSWAEWGSKKRLPVVTHVEECEAQT